MHADIPRELVDPNISARQLGADVVGGEIGVCHGAVIPRSRSDVSDTEVR